MNQVSANWTNSSETNSSLTRSNSANYFFGSIIVYYVLFACGAVLNSIVVFVMLRSGKIRQNISSFLIFHLSLTHLFYLILSFFKIIGPFIADSTSCKAASVMDLACAAAIFNSLVAIAWDRYRNVLRPFQSLAPKHWKTYILLVAAIWTYAFITSVPFIYSVRTEFRVICSKDNNGTESCKTYNFCHLPSDWKTQLSKTIYFLLAFVIPLMYMFLAYTKIAVSLWERSKNGIIHGAVAKSKVKSTRLMVVAVLGFVFCWGPTFWLDLLTVYGAVEHSLILWILCFLTQTSSSCINPAIYAFFSPEFRKLFVRFCCCGCSFRRG
ncbi:hypothetical protein ACROYT_G034925, partial [Oculina patagonica]